jgi:N-acetylglucosaminyldiphosphoundecaprenol N-acetyl-beta-D-mannosaminyltransferase
VLSEPTYWLLGLPFDAIGMEESVRRIQEAARARRRLIVITPNVNFVSMAAGDAAFRDCLLESQLSLADGMPLVWLGRRNGIPFPERVAGSSLLLRLAAGSTGRPLGVHFFGGDRGVAELAASRLPGLGGGLVDAGWTDPGFGSIDSMSSAQYLERINNSGADLLVLALGAKKGHEWIARNQDRVHIPVISHLGATVNFIAGTVERAPVWVQNSGLEWIWRILQEPKLLRRYWTDGLMFLQMLRQQATQAGDPARDGPERMLATLRAALDSPGPVRSVDVADAGPLDSRTLGLLYAWRYRLPGCEFHRLTCTSMSQRALLRKSRAECLLTDTPGTAATAK